MKRLLIISLTISMILLTSCYSYKDMNRVYFSTMSLIDKSSNGNIVLYEELFASDRGSTEQGGTITRIVLKSQGKSYYDAFSNMQGSATYPINYNVKRAVGLTEKIARTVSIENIIGSLERDHELTNKVFLFICSTNPEEILNLEMEDEKFIGIWLEDIFIFQKNEARILSIRANEYLNERVKGSRVSILPIVDIEKHPVENRLKISGAAVMKDSKMVDKLSLKDIPIYRTLFNGGDDLIGTFDVIYPPTETQVTLEPLKMKNKERIEIIGERLTLIYDLNLVCSIRSVYGSLDLLNQNVRKELKKVAEETIKFDIEDFYKNFQKKGIDILDVEAKLRRKYRDTNTDNINDKSFKNVDIQVNVSILIDGSQNTTYTID